MQVVIYWLARTAIFLAIYGALWALKWFDIWAVLIAFIVAWIVGYIALPGLRAKAAAQMDGWISRSQRGIDKDHDVEDAEVAGTLAQEGDASGDSDSSSK